MTPPLMWSEFTMKGRPFSTNKEIKGREDHKTTRSSNPNIRGPDRMTHKAVRQQSTTKG